MRSKLVLSVVACGALVGCSGPQLSEEDAVVGFSAASMVLSTGSSMAVANVGAAAQAEETPSFRAEGEAAVDFTYNCPGGGTARFAGSAVAASAESGGNVTFSLNTDFAACGTINSVTIDGGIDYASSVTGSAEAVSVEFSMDGSLSFSGQVEGDCDIDVKFSLSASQGAAGGSYKGSFCGHDASSTFKTQG